MTSPLLRPTVLVVPAGYLLIWLALLAWSRTAGAWHCLAVLVLVLTATVLIALGLQEARLMRRRAWLGQYLREQGRLYTLLRGGWLMRLVTILTAAGLAVLLLGQSLLWGGWVWLLLFADIWVLYLLQQWFHGRLAAEVRPGYRLRVSRLFALWGNVIMLTLALAAISVLEPQLDYRGAPLDVVIQQATRSADWSCALFGVVERVLLLNRELTYWLMQNVFDDARAGGAVALLAWLLVFVLSSAYSWAYTRVLLGVSSLLWTEHAQDDPA